MNVDVYNHTNCTNLISKGGSLLKTSPKNPEQISPCRKNNPQSEEIHNMRSFTPVMLLGFIFWGYKR